MPTPTALPAAARTKPREPLKPLCLFFVLHTHFYLFVFNKRTFYQAAEKKQTAEVSLINGVSNQEEGNGYFKETSCMNEINIYIGGQIRKYRKANGMTLQQLADVIHKSRATVCKYESGEISIDIATLYEISQALQVSFGQLTSYQPTLPPSPPPTVGTLQRSPFFQAKRLYFYFYDGRYHRLKDGVIDIHEHAERPGTYVASFTLCSVSGNGCSNESYYTGNVVYSDMLIRFTFFNQLNPLEEDLLYIFNPLEMRDYTDGLLCGISSADLMPCAFRCLVTLNPQELDESLRQRLLFSKQEIRRWGKLNMLLIGNRSAEDSAFL